MTNRQIRVRASCRIVVYAHLTAVTIEPIACKVILSFFFFLAFVGYLPRGRLHVADCHPPKMAVTVGFIVRGRCPCLGSIVRYSLSPPGGLRWQTPPGGSPLLVIHRLPPGGLQDAVIHCCRQADFSRYGERRSPSLLPNVDLPVVLPLPSLVLSQLLHSFDCFCQFPTLRYGELRSPG